MASAAPGATVEFVALLQLIADLVLLIAKAPFPGQATSFLFSQLSSVDHEDTFICSLKLYCTVDMSGSTRSAFYMHTHNPSVAATKLGKLGMGRSNTQQADTACAEHEHSVSSQQGQVGASVATTPPTHHPRTHL